MWRAIISIVVLITIWAVGLLWFIAAIPTEAEAPETQADAIVVLTGGSERLSEGLSLLKQGQGKTLFISGVGDGVTLEEVFPHGSYVPEELEVLRAHIALGFVARNTHGNATEVAEWMTQQRYHSMVLVTSQYHFPRSILEIRKTLPEVTIYAHPVASPYVKLDSWWQYPGTAALLATEYHKYVVTCIRIWLQL